MLNLRQSAGSNWPAKLAVIPQLVSGMPALAHAYDDHRLSSTSAVGSCLEALCGTVGEFMERRHFYNELVPGELMLLSEMMGSTAYSSFVEALNQTAREDLRPRIDDHRFYSTQVYNLFSHEAVLVPSIFLSITGHLTWNDNGFLPSRDTTGCSAHVRLDKALDGAVKELIERQCLLRYWLTKEVKQEVVIDEGVNLLDSDSSSLINRLSDSGQLRIFDITIPGFPGAAVISLYGNAASKTVNYCTGMSYGSSVKDAIEKSIVELWQSFTFLHYFKIGGYALEDIDDSYQIHFLNCNKYDTFRLMTDVQVQSQISMPDYLQKPLTSSQSLHQHLRTISENVFFYVEKEALKDHLVWFVRVFSPDLFLHMNGSGPLNHRNAISSEFPHIEEERTTKMVPFP